MNNNQYPIIEPSMSNNVVAPQNKSKTKLVAIIAIVVAVVIGIVVTVVIVLSQRGDEKPVVNKDTDTLQMYAELDDEIMIDDLRSVVKRINAGAKIEYGDGYGTIKMSDSSGDFISFYFDVETDEDTTDAIVEDEDEEEVDEEAHTPNTAYGFTYVVPINGDEENSMTISCDKTCYYYDGADIHEFSTKKEAIDAYLK